MFSKRRALADTRVLWLSNETPDVGGQGGQRRQYFQIRGLAHRGIPVDVMTIAGPQRDTSIREFARVIRIRRVLPGGVKNPIQWRHAERAARSGCYSHVVVAHLESWALLGPSPGTVPSKVIVDVHNVMSGWHASLGNEAQARWFDNLENQVVRAADAVSVCSSAELDRLPPGGDAARMVLPHGVDMTEWPDGDAPSTESKQVAMFGSWNWYPNRRGLEWFLDRVWPEVHDREPDSTLHIAGTVDRAVVPDRGGVVYRGRVPDLAEYTHQARAIVVPVLHGVGASVKFGESLASGRPVVSTVDASTAHPGSPAIVSDDPSVWIQTLQRWLRDPAEADRMGQAARQFAQARLSWARTVAPLIDWIDRTDVGGGRPIATPNDAANLRDGND